MKTRFAVLAACAGLSVSGFALAAENPTFTSFDGGAPVSGEIHGKLNGHAVTVLRITADYHQMGLPAHHAQPIGLREFFYFLKPDTVGNTARCETWVKKVQKDEAAWTQASPTFPYLEINIATGAKPLTIGGNSVYRDADVLCWEAFDLGQPIF